MFVRIPYIFPGLRLRSTFCLVMMLFLGCQLLFAAQDGVVISEEAIIYADELMTSPVGFVRRGKKVRLGEVARNQERVYPIVVSGRVAFIRAQDVSTEKQSSDYDAQLAQRFQKNAEKKSSSRYGLSWFNYPSQIRQEKNNGSLKNNDPVNWQGVSLQGSAFIKEYLEFEMLFNLMNAKEGQELYRVVELGTGLGVRLIDKGPFVLKLSGELLAIPFSSYALGKIFRVNGYGFTTGAVVSAHYRLGEHWGLSAYSGGFYSKMYNIEPPAPYHAINPSFTGTRLGVGVSYEY
jgi:hypothetical protein